MAYLGSQLTSFDPTRSIPAPRDADRFSGNGSTTSFTLSRSVNAAVDIEVFVENVQQEPLTAYDVNGTSLNFTGAPPSGTNNVYVVYRNFQSGAQVTMPDGSVTYSKLANNLRIFTTDNLTPNGNNSVFTLSEPPADANTVMVTVDGIIQRAPVHYTTSGSTITFTSAPAAGSNVHVRHLGFRTSATVTQLAANSTISQPTLQSPVVTGSLSMGTAVLSNTSGNALRLSGQTGSTTTPLSINFAQDYSSNVASANTCKIVFYNDASNKDVYGLGVGPNADMMYHAALSGGGKGSHKFYVNEQLGLQIDAGGRVTTPLQPGFLAGIASASDTTVSSGAFVPFNNVTASSGVTWNTGSCFNTGTYKFTTPVAGTYLFTYTLYLTNSASSTLTMQACLNIDGGYNSVTSSDVMGVMAATPNSLGGIICLTWSGLVRMNANQVVGVSNRSGNILRIYQGHSYFSGQLIG